MTLGVRSGFAQMGCQNWIRFRLKLLRSVASSFVAPVALHRYFGLLGREINEPAAGLALRYVQQLSKVMEGCWP